MKAILTKYDHSGMYVKQGLIKGLRIDSEYLKVHRLTSNQGVGSSGPKSQTPFAGEDIVKTSSRGEAVINDQKLTTSDE